MAEITPSVEPKEPVAPIEPAVDDPKMVPHESLLDERNKRKALRDELDELKAKDAERVAADLAKNGEFEKLAQTHETDAKAARAELEQVKSKSAVTTAMMKAGVAPAMLEDAVILFQSGELDTLPAFLEARPHLVAEPTTKKPAGVGPKGDSDGGGDPARAEIETKIKAAKKEVVDSGYRDENAKGKVRSLTDELNKLPKST